jgi:acyl-coenzyme A synthetase/AMP-(fatty) acid ligase
MTSLWDSVANSSGGLRGAFHGPHHSLPLTELEKGSCLGSGLEALRGRSVLLALKTQTASAVALLELDGVARRLVLCTPDLSPERLAEVARTAEIDAIVADAPVTIPGIEAPVYLIEPKPLAVSGQTPFSRRTSGVTEWILLTSGTTGSPKLVLHTLASLAGTLPRQTEGTDPVWSTFYDIRRYGGLQIYLRAVLSSAPLVLSSATEPTPEYLARAGALGVTHISGTPSHWRRALMSGAAPLLKPAYVRLSGEVADQVLLDQLHATYPHARIAHAFASTEAGVAFDVNDGHAGFPAEFLDGRNGIEMKVEDGTLRIRSQRTATRYLGSEVSALTGGEGWVDTGDLVELNEGRYYFRGRKGGIINVGGQKVYPEEVESVLNADPRVRMSLVRSRRSPIMGAVVVADVVLNDGVNAAHDAAVAEALKDELLNSCRQSLPPYKVPAMLRFVPALELTAAGKLVRPGA